MLTSFANSHFVRGRHSLRSFLDISHSVARFKGVAVTRHADGFLSWPEMPTELRCLRQNKSILFWVFFEIFLATELRFDSY